MNLIFSYIQDYFRITDKWILFFGTCFAALLILLNYSLNFETKWIGNLPTRMGKFAGFYCLYSIAFIVPYLLILCTRHATVLNNRYLWLLLLTAPAIFAAKVTMPPLLNLSVRLPEQMWWKYFAILINLPFRLLMVLVPLFILFHLEKYHASFFGISAYQFDWKPYCWMLLVMVPLIAFVATRHDFLLMYPKLKQVQFMQQSGMPAWLYRLLFEISYGTDFITIELFFRGFLVFAFVRYVGADAILPMAVFYCSIHFGKPLMECISSFFGGLLLGIIAYRTQSIVGGILVHLGIAWMMEAGAYIGNYFQK